MQRKDGSDHKHDWQTITVKRGDLVESLDKCSLCGLRSRKGRTQHPIYQPTARYQVA